MEVVILRFLSMGYSVKETAKITQYPEGYVRNVEIVNQEI